MSLLAYAVRRVALLVPTLFGVTALTFVLIRVLPGDGDRVAPGAGGAGGAGRLEVVGFVMPWVKLLLESRFFR